MAYTAGTIGSSVTGTLGSNVVFPSGHIIQTKGDNYSKASGLTVATTSERLLGTNLEIAMTCKSTSNFLRVSTFLPNYYNGSGATQALKIGFRYSTDSFSSSDVDLGLQWIETRHGLINPNGDNLQLLVFVETWIAVPTTDPIKIQVATQAYVGSVQIFCNASATEQTGSLIVQEIQT